MDECPLGTSTKKKNAFYINVALDTVKNACLACHSDCMENMCLEFSYLDSNSDKCTNCSDPTKFLTGTLYIGGSCVTAIECISGTRLIYSKY